MHPPDIFSFRYTDILLYLLATISVAVDVSWNCQFKYAMGEGVLHCIEILIIFLTVYINNTDIKLLLRRCCCILLNISHIDKHVSTNTVLTVLSETGLQAYFMSSSRFFYVRVI